MSVVLDYITVVWRLTLKQRLPALHIIITVSAINFVLVIQNILEVLLCIFVCYFTVLQN